jgi:hypothetical protein
MDTSISRADGGWLRGEPEPSSEQAPQDLSPRMVELARVLDRLPPGKHIITLEKPEVRAMDWEVCIETVQHNRKMRLTKRSNGRS